MAWSITDDVHEFLTAAGDFLRARAAEHTVMLSVAEGLRVDASPRGEVPNALGWWTGPDGVVGGACLHTPPYGLVLSDLPAPAAVALAARFAEQGRPLSQVQGAHDGVDAFAEEWLRRHPGVTSAVAMRQRLYRLGDLVEPATPGKPRPAATADRDLLMAWRKAFQSDIGVFVHGDLARGVDDVLSYGGFALWTVDESPVSMASVTRPAAGMVRIGSVYTPPEHRRNGYAGGLVASIGRAAREAGTTEVVLYTDLANPTSNSVYQRIGFRPVEDSIVLDLVAP